MSDTTSQKSGSFTSLINFLAALGKLAIVLVVLIFASSMLGSGSGSPPLGWKRVHSQTTFTEQTSLAATPENQNPADRPKPMVVLRFNGTDDAADRNSIARSIDEIITNKQRIAGVIVVSNSPGGGVAQYGQLYADMKRLRDNDIDLTFCIDTYGASGGYLMALPANRIVAAPFAMVGSIGVVSEQLNYNGLLKRLGIEPLVMTAGKRKRTVTSTGEITEDGLQHYKGQLEAIHRQFIAAVHTFRPDIDTDEVCNGDHWTAQESVDQNLGLVDQLSTSAEYLLTVRQTRGLLFLSEPSVNSGGLLGLLSSLSDHVVDRAIDKLRAGPDNIR